MPPRQSSGKPHAIARLSGLDARPAERFLIAGRGGLDESAGRPPPFGVAVPDERPAMPMAALGLGIGHDAVSLVGPHRLRQFPVGVKHFDVLLADEKPQTGPTLLGVVKVGLQIQLVAHADHRQVAQAPAIPHDDLVGHLLAEDRRLAFGIAQGVDIARIQHDTRTDDRVGVHVGGEVHHGGETRGLAAETEVPGSHRAVVVDPALVVFGVDGGHAADVLPASGRRGSRSRPGPSSPGHWRSSSRPPKPDRTS